MTYKIRHRAVSPPFVGGPVLIEVALSFAWLPDAIVQAGFELVRSVLLSAFNGMFNIGLLPLLLIDPALVDSPQVSATWTTVFELSIALLPILIAVGVLSLPFARRGEASVWLLTTRLVGVLVFIGISRELFGFLIEVSNAVTAELSPDTFVLSFGTNLGDGWGTAVGTGVEVVALAVAVVLMLFATILSSLLLVLRQFIILSVLVGAPFFGVLTVLDWGPTRSVSGFAASWLRMGVFAILVGPIIGLVMRVFNIIAAGGLSVGGDLSGFYVSTALTLMLPVILFVVVFKTVSWAGQPLGVQSTFSMVVATAAAAGGIAVAGAGAGAGAAGAGGAAGGGGAASGSGSAGSTAGSGASAGVSAGGSTASTGGSTVGTLRSSVGDALSARQPPVEDDIDPAPGVFDRLPGVGPTTRGGSTARRAARKAGSASNTLATGVTRRASGAARLDSYRQSIQTSLEEAASADDEATVMGAALRSGELDVGRAYEAGAIEAPPASTDPVPVNDGVAEYPVDGGGIAQLRVRTRVHRAAVLANSSRSDAAVAARGARRVQRARSAAGTGARVGLTAGAAGGVSLLGGLSKSPYTAYRVGKDGGKLIRPNRSVESNDHVIPGDPVEPSEEGDSF